MPATLISMIELTVLRSTMDMLSDSITAQRIRRLVFSQTLTTDEMDAIVSTPGLPSRKQPYKIGDARLLNKMSIAGLGETGSEFLLTEDYSVPSNEAFEENPLDRPDEIAGDSSMFQQGWHVDYSSPTPQNRRSGSGWPLPNDPTQKSSEQTMTITGNRSSLDLATVYEYLYPACAINDAEVTVRGITIPLGVALLTKHGFARVVENSYHYWRRTWQLSLAPNWDEVREDRSFYELDTDSDNPLATKQIIRAGDWVRSPWPLVEGQAVVDLGYSGDLLTFKPQPPKDFSVFGWTAAE